MDIHTYFTQLDQSYSKHANEEDAFFMAKYLKNHFSFYGLKRPLRYEISKAHIETHGMPEGEELVQLCHLCFEAEKRELQYFVNDLVRPLVKKLDPSFMSTIHELIPKKSWWDTIDFLSPKLAGPLVKNDADLLKEWTSRWIHSDNFWYQRSAILLQLDYKQATDKDLLYQLILQKADSKEFFVQKAGGWALRNYTRIDAKSVIDFVNNNELPKLTAREGLKWLKNKGLLD
ncbi:MAG: DNA alkylation repair protein [Bacteroidota bacterium]